MLLYSLLLGFWASAALATPPPGYVKKPDNDKDPPAYSYRYEIGEIDGKGQGKSETRSGEFAKGRYYVNSEGSSTDVKYFADEWGYHPLVHYGLADKHSATSASLAIGEPAVTALKNGGEVGPNVELPKIAPRRPVQIIQPYTIEKDTSPTKNYNSGEEVVPEVIQASDSTESTSGEPAEGTKPEPNDTQPILLIPNNIPAESSTDGFTKSSPIYRITTAAPLPEVTVTNTNLLDDVLLVQNDGNFGQRLPTRVTNNLGYQTTTSASTTGSFKFTNQNDQVTYRIHDVNNPNRAFLKSLKKNQNQERLSQYLYSQQQFAPTGRVNISDSILQGLQILSTTAAPAVPTPTSQLSTAGEINYEYSNTIEHEKQNYPGLSSYTSASSKTNLENIEKSPEVIKYDVKVTSSTNEKLTTPGLSAYTTKTSPSYESESSTSSSTSRGSFSKPIVVAELARFRPEYSTTFRCEDEVSSTPNPGHSTTLGPAPSDETILVTAKPPVPGHITTSAVVLNPIQAGVALVNAGEAHLIDGDTSGTPAPVKEEVDEDSENAGSYDQRELVHKKDDTKVYYEKVKPSFGSDRNHVKDILEQEVEVQKSVEVYHNSPVHEIHFPAELVRTSQSYPVQDVNQVSNQDSGGTGFDFRNGIYAAGQGADDKFGSGNILEIVDTSLVTKSQSLKLRDEGAFQRAGLRGLVNKAVNGRMEYRLQGYGDQENSQRQVIEQDGNRQVYQSEITNDAQESTEQQSVNSDSPGQAYQPRIRVEENRENVHGTVDVQAYQPQVYVENAQNAQQQVINEANAAQAYQPLVYVGNGENAQEENINEANIAQAYQPQVYVENAQNAQQQIVTEANNAQAYQPQVYVEKAQNAQNALQQIITEANNAEVYQPQVYVKNAQNAQENVNEINNAQVYQQHNYVTTSQNAQQQSTNEARNSQVYQPQNYEKNNQNFLQLNDAPAYQPQIYIENNQNQQSNVPINHQVYQSQITQQNIEKHAQSQSDLNLVNVQSYKSNENGATYNSDSNNAHQQFAAALPYTLEASKEIHIPGVSNAQNIEDTQKSLDKFLDYTIKIPPSNPIAEHAHESRGYILQIEKKIPYPVPHIIEKKVEVPKPYPVHVQVEKVVEKKYPQPIVVEKVIKQPAPQPYPVEKIVEKTIHVPQPYPVEIEKIIEKKVPYPVEKIIEKKITVPQPYPVHIQVPVDRIIEKHVPVPQPYPVHIEKIVEKKIPYPIEKLVPQPYPVHIRVPQPYPVEIEKIIERKVPYPVPIHVPYGIQYGVSYQQIMKPQTQNLYSTYQTTQTPPFYGSPIIKTQESLSDPTTHFHGYQYNKPSITFLEGTSKLNTMKRNQVYHSGSTVTPSANKKYQLLYQPYQNPYSGSHRRYALRIDKVIKDQYIGPVPPEVPTNQRNPKNSLDPQPKSSQFISTVTKPPSTLTTRKLRPEVHLQTPPGTFRQSKMEYGFKPPMVPSVQYDEKTARKVET